MNNIESDKIIGRYLNSTGRDPYTQHLLLQHPTQISHLMDTKALCKSPWSMYFIPSTQSLIILLCRFRKDFSYRRKSRGNIISDPWTLSYPPQHRQILLTSCIPLQKKFQKCRQHPLTNNLPSWNTAKHTKFGTIFGLILPHISISFSSFCNCVPHFLYDKLTELGSEDLDTRLLTEDAILKVTQYDFNT